MSKLELKDIPKGSKLKVNTNKGKRVITFHHLDGMYSYLTDAQGNAYHLSFATPLIKKGDYYEINDK